MMSSEVRRIAPPYFGWILANAVGVSLFLYFCSLVWAPRGEEGLLGGPGDGIIWLFTALPVAVVWTVLDLGWLLLIFLRRRRYQFWRGLLVWLLTILVWVGAYLYARSRAFTGCDIYPEDVSCIIRQHGHTAK